MSKRMKAAALAAAMMLVNPLAANASPTSIETTRERPSDSPARENSQRALLLIKAQQVTEHHLEAQADRRTRHHKAALAAKRQRIDSRIVEARIVTPRASRSESRRVFAKTSLSGWKAKYFAEAQVWAQTPKARSVAECESGGNPKSISATGKYRGKWQMDADFWASYGGLDLASRPDLASESEQNYVAYRGYVSAGWGRWECA